MRRLAVRRPRCYAFSMKRDEMKLNAVQWLLLGATAAATLWVLGDIANLWQAEPIEMMLVFGLLTVIGWKVWPSNAELDKAMRSRNRRRH